MVDFQFQRPATVREPGGAIHSKSNVSCTLTYPTTYRQVQRCRLGMSELSASHSDVVAHS